MRHTSWHDLFFLHSINQSAAYLKMMSEVWGIQVRSIVEIGVFKGCTSKQLRTLFPDALLYLVDPWKLYEEYLTIEAGPISQIPEVYERAFEEVKKTFEKDSHVKIVRKTSLEAALEIPDGIDLVYIDGNHSYLHVKQDIQYWFSKIRPGGILSGHDYDPILFPDVIRAVDEMFPEGVLTGQNFTWLKQKPS